MNPGNIVEVEIFDYSSGSVRLCQGGKIFCILNRSLRLHIIVSRWKSLLTFALEYYRVLFSYFRFFCILIDDFQSEEPMAGEKLFLKVDG